MAKAGQLGRNEPQAWVATYFAHAKWVIGKYFFAWRSSSHAWHAYFISACPKECLAVGMALQAIVSAVFMLLAKLNSIFTKKTQAFVLFICYIAGRCLLPGMRAGRVLDQWKIVACVEGKKSALAKDDGCVMRKEICRITRRVQERRS